MKGCVVAFDTWNGHPAAARMIDGKLDDLLIDLDDALPRPGAIYRAICERPMKGQGGMFLTLPDGQKGFLRQAKGSASGDALMVQVTGYAEAGKAVPVTPRVVFKSRYVLVTPGAPGLNVARSIREEETRDHLLELAHGVVPEWEGAGIILRSAAAHVAAEEIEEDLSATWQTAQAVMADQGAGPELLLEGPNAAEQAWIEWSTPIADEVSEAGFEALGIAEQIEALRSPLVRLESGSAYIEPTRALVAVDVNTGRDTSPAAGLKVNLALAKALPRALRLRGLAGQVVLDLAPMSKKDRRQFETSLNAALRADPIETTGLGWTNLGHYELTRKRERRPLGEVL